MSEHEQELTTITTERHNVLLAAERMLIALQNAGVDNWEGYEYAQAEVREVQS